MNHHWECAICHDSIKSPVRANCGHVFCWRCLCEHMKNSNNCPICHTILEEKKFIAIYGHGSEDPHLEELPPLPEFVTPSPPPPPNQNNNPNMNNRREQVRVRRRHQRTPFFNDMPIGEGFIYTNIGGFQFYRRYDIHDQEADIDQEERNNQRNPVYNPPRIPRWVVSIFFVLLFIILATFSNDPLI